MNSPSSTNCAFSDEHDEEADAEQSLFNLEHKLKLFSVSASSSSSSSSCSSSAYSSCDSTDDIAFYNLQNLIHFFDHANTSDATNSICSSSHHFSHSNAHRVASSKIVSGIAGRAKKHEPLTTQPSESAVETSSSSSLKTAFTFSNNETQTFNFGDDVGFVLSKLDPLTSSNTHYFGIADGVSANRLRGYDAKLFPSALLSACTHLIATSMDNESSSRLG